MRNIPVDTAQLTFVCVSAPRPNLMARMGHDNERAALRYQHQSRQGDRQIADGLDALVRAEEDQDDEDDGGAAGVLVPVA